jgi:hypothetical protein
MSQASTDILRRLEELAKAVPTLRQEAAPQPQPQPAAGPQPRQPQRPEGCVPIPPELEDLLQSYTAAAALANNDTELLQRLKQRARERLLAMKDRLDGELKALVEILS